MSNAVPQESRLVRQRVEALGLHPDATYTLIGPDGARVVIKGSAWHRVPAPLAERLAAEPASDLPGGRETRRFDVLDEAQFAAAARAARKTPPAERIARAKQRAKDAAAAASAEEVAARAFGADGPVDGVIDLMSAAAPAPKKGG